MPGRRANRASMMVVVLMITLVLMMLVMVVGSNTLINMRATSAVTDKREARYAAYAGLQRAMVELQKNAKWKGPLTDESMPGKQSLVYTVKVKNNLLGLLDQTGIPAEQQVPLNAVALEAIAGDRSDPTKPMRAVTGLKGMAIPLGGMFQQAAMCDSTVTMTTGAKTEAFDFGAWKGTDRATEIRDAAYGWIDDPNAERGKVHANRRMTVSGGAQVDGDVTLPYQDDDETGLKKGKEYTGKESILTTRSKMPGFTPPIDPKMATVSLNNFPPTVEDNDGEGDGDGDGDDGVVTKPFRLPEGAYKSIQVPAGQQLELTTGTYYFKDLFEIHGEIVVNAANGPVIVHVGEKMVVAGSGRINKGLADDGRPRDLQVYFTDELLNPDYDPGESAPKNPLDVKEKKKISILEMAPGSQATMVAAGKNTKANIGTNARLMGALVADHMNLTGGKIQYDVDLKSGNFFDNCPWDLQGVHESSVER